MPGVTDTADQTYTVVGASVTGFIASATGHVCAAVPTVQALLRFCQNGFKAESQASSSYAKDSSYNSSTKRSYKTLEGKKSSSSFPDHMSGAAQQRSNSGSVDPHNPFGVSSSGNAGEDIGIIELQPVSSDPKRTKEQSSTEIHEISGPGLEDSASDRAILHGDPYR